MKKIILFLLLISGTGFSQEKSINNYKYVIIPEKFDFLKEPNQFNLNELVKMVFEKYGFEVYIASQKLPEELALDKCEALYGDLVSDSGLMNTTLYLTMTDCNGKVLFTSQKGKSKQKEYRKAYTEALRGASKSLETLNYKYEGKDRNITKPANELKPPSNRQDVAPLAQNTINDTPLYAQPITNGYQLVDSTPKVVLRLYKTSNPDSFTAVTEGINGIVFKKGNDWIFEYYLNDELVSQKLDIKF